MRYRDDFVTTRQDAKISGATHYQGIPCPHGHNGVRYTSSGNCIECALAYVKSRTESGYFNQRYADMDAQTKLDQCKDYYAKNRVKKIQDAVAWGKENPLKRSAITKRYKATQRATNPVFVIGERLRARIRVVFQRNRYNKNNKTESIIGCSFDELKAHIEKRFVGGMCWERFNEIHIDHITPLIKAKTVDDIYRLCHYTNLQPLWAKDNLSKGARTTVTPEMLKA